MTVRADKLRSETPSRTRRGWYGTELWEVWDSSDGTSGGTTNENGVVDPTKFAAVADLPQYGTQGPLPGTLYTDIRVSEVVANWSYIVQATYASFGLYNGGPPRSVARASAGPDIINIPVFVRRSITSGPNAGQVYWWEEPHQFRRSTITRTEVRIVTDSPTVVTNAMADNLGKFYMIGGRWYVFDGGSVDPSTVSLNRIEYHLRSSSWISAVPAGAMGNLVPIPELPPCHDYQVDTSTNPPTITAVPPSITATVGGQMPGFP